MLVDRNRVVLVVFNVRHSQLLVREEWARHHFRKTLKTKEIIHSASQERQQQARMLRIPHLKNTEPLFIKTAWAQALSRGCLTNLSITRKRQAALDSQSREFLQKSLSVDHQGVRLQGTKTTIRGSRLLRITALSQIVRTIKTWTRSYQPGSTEALKFWNTKVNLIVPNRLRLRLKISASKLCKVSIKITYSAALKPLQLYQKAHQHQQVLIP